MAVALALVSAATYGVADFLGGLASRRTAVLAVVVLSQLTGLVVVLAALSLLPGATWTTRDLGFGAAAGVAGGLGLVAFYRGLAVAPMSVVAPVTALLAAGGPVLVGLARGDRPGAPALVGVAVALAAVVLVAQDGAVGPARSGAGLVLALPAGAGFAAFFVLLEPTSAGSGLWPLAAARAGSVLLLAAVGVASATRGAPGLVPDRAALPLVLAAGSLDMAANIAYLLAVREGLLSLVAVITSLYPAGTVVLARLVLGERLRGRRRLGLLVAAAAVVLIAL